MENNLKGKFKFIYSSKIIEDQGGQRKMKEMGRMKRSQEHFLFVCFNFPLINDVQFLRKF